MLSTVITCTWLKVAHLSLTKKPVGTFMVPNVKNKFCLGEEGGGGGVAEIPKF